MGVREVSSVRGGSRCCWAKRLHDGAKACGEFINVELTTKMARTGNQISPAESCYSYVTICQVRYPTVLAFIMHTHTKARGYSVRSFVGILNQSKPDLWNAVVVIIPKNESRCCDSSRNSFCFGNNKISPYLQNTKVI